MQIHAVTHCCCLRQVPMDQPKPMLSLFGDFVQGRLFEHNTPRVDTVHAEQLEAIASQ